MRRTIRLSKNKKGVSTLFIAIYLALLATVLISTLFFALSISHSSLTSYLKNDQDRMQEKIVVEALTIGQNNEFESVLINNTGGITVRIRSIYVAGRFECDPSKLLGDSYISPQSFKWIDLSSVHIDVDFETYYGNWTVTTERGTKSSDTGKNLLPGSNTNEDPNKLYFGPLLLIFNDFKWSNNNGISWNDGWTIPNDPGDVIWRINVTNIDDRVIILSTASSFGLIQNSQQSNKIATWGIGPADLNPPDLTLIPNVDYHICFSLNGPNSLDYMSTPIPIASNFLTMIGNFIESDGSLKGFAQTIPFEAVRISSPLEIITYTTLNAIPSPRIVGQSTPVSGQVSVDPGNVTVPSNSVVVIQYSPEDLEQWTNILVPVIRTGSEGLFSGSFSPPHAGTYKFRAVFMGANQGQSSWLVSASATQTITVNQAPSTVTVQPPLPITLGQSTALTATVTPSFATGTVTFEISTDNGVTFGFFSNNSIVSGTAVSNSYNPSAPGNNYRFRATYRGDSDVLPSPTSASVTLTVNKATPTLTIPTLNPPSPISIGESVTATVTITSLPGFTPTGTITFQVSTDGGINWNPIGLPITLASSSVTSDPYTPPSGGSQYRIRADYSGDSNYNGVSSALASLTVRTFPSISTPTLTPSSDAPFGTPITVAVTVSGSYGTPTGSIDFQVSTDGGATFTQLGGTKLLTSGAATSDPYEPAAPGSNYRFRAIYNGDSNVQPSTSTEATLTVYGPLTHFVFEPIGAQTAGTPFNITMTAKDASENTVLNYVGSNVLSSSVGTISPTDTGAFTNGTRTLTVTFTTAGEVSIITTGGGASGQSNNFIVNPALLNRFSFAPISSPQTAGAQFSLTITAQDTYGNTVTSYTGTNTLTVPAGTISPTTTTAFSNGVWTGTVSLTLATQNTNVTTTGGGRTGTSNNFAVQATSFDHFAFNTINNQITDVPFSITITALDTYGNVAVSFAGTNSLTDLSNSISPASTGNFFNGTWTGTVTIANRHPADTISTSGDGKLGTSNTFAVTGPLDHFSFNTIGNQVAGAPFIITITAVDSTNNVITGYTGANTLTVTTGTINPTSTGSFNNGICTVSVTLNTAGSGITISTSGATITGTSNAFTVAPAALDHFTMTNYPTSTTAGQVFNGVTVTAFDVYNNVKTDYLGQVYFTSTDAQATLPFTSSNRYTFSSGDSGTHIFDGFALKTAGSHTITVRDDSALKTLTSSSITVNPTSVDRFSFGTITSPKTVNTAFTITITALDLYGNTATGYNSLTALTASAGAGTISPSSVTFSNGQWSGSVTLNTVGIGVIISATNGGTIGASNSFDIYGTARFSATINPTTFHSGANQQYSITITNLDSINTKLSSATIAIPSGFTVTSVSVTSLPPGKTWTSNIAGGIISLSSTGGSRLDPGQSIIVSFTPTLTPSSGSTFTWTTSAAGFSTPNPQPQTIIQYQLTVSSAYATPTGQGWYNSGSTAYAGLSSGTVSGGAGTQFIFTNWSTDASGTNYAQSNAIAMNGPKAATANWQTQYELAVDSGGHGTATGSGWKNSGTLATYSINPTTVPGQPGTQYVFVSWSGSSTSTDATSTILMNGPAVVTATWQTQYEMTASAGSNGLISPSGIIFVNAGASQIYSITPNVGYHVLDVIVDGSSIGPATSYTFNSLSTSHTIQASFAINIYTIDAVTDSYTTISPGNLTLDYGASQTFTITPNSGYHLDTLTVDGTPIPLATTYSFTNIDANHAIAATSTVNQYTIAASAGANGGISPSGNVVVNHGDSQTFTITPSLHYHIADVLVDGYSVGAIGTYTFTDVTSSHVISASFSIDSYTITVTAGVNGAISPGTQIFDYGTSQTYSITPSLGYHVLDVKVDSVSVGSVTTYAFSDIAADHTLEATFEINAYSITASAASGGSISPVGTATVTHGGSQTFSVTPDVGYHVIDVLVDGISQGAISAYTFSNVQTDHSILATFEVNTYTITATAGSGGTINPIGSVFINFGGSQPFAISPDAGYNIADVTVDGISVGAVAIYNFENVTSDHTISAVFVTA